MARFACLTIADRRCLLLLLHTLTPHVRQFDSPTLCLLHRRLQGSGTTPVAGQPFPGLPNPALSVPAQNASNCLVLVTGGTGQSIALATALQYNALGCAVTVTSRNPKSYNKALIAGTNIQLVGLDLGGRSGNKYRACTVGQNFMKQWAVVQTSWFTAR